MVLTDAMAAWKFVDSRKLVFNADTRIVGTMDDIPLACLSAACTVGGGIWFWDKGSDTHNTLSHTHTPVVETYRIVDVIDFVFGL